MNLFQETEKFVFKFILRNIVLDIMPYLWCMWHSEQNKTVRRLDPMTEAAGMSERSVYIYKTKPCRNPEDNSKYSYIFLQKLRLIYVYIYVYIYNRPICVCNILISVVTYWESIWYSGCEFTGTLRVYSYIMLSLIMRYLLDTNIYFHCIDVKIGKH
jgi:hypothetical protein